MTHMTAETARAIRLAHSYSLSQMADILRIADRSTIHRWESGERDVTGPASVVYELVDAGKLPPEYLPKGK